MKKQEWTVDGINDIIVTVEQDHVILKFDGWYGGEYRSDSLWMKPDEAENLVRTLKKALDAQRYLGGDF